MTMSEVYFIDARKRNGVPITEKLETVLEKVGAGPESNLKGNIALKMHMGERNNETFIKPFYVKKIAEIVKKQGGDPFVTDTTTLYKFDRFHAMDYYRTAFEHGFLPSYLGCPVIIADGLKDDGVEVSETVEIARSIYESDGMVVISHATGHGTASFGGAIKNVAMGCVTKKSKIYQHEVTKPVYDEELCTQCDACIEECKFGAIETKENGDRELIKENCVGCGCCIGAGETGALHLQEGAGEELQLRIAEVANTVMRNLPYSNYFFINFLIDITPFCDCEGIAPKYICPDIGILSSKDAVAIDQATIDLIGRHSFEGDPAIQVREAHRLGLGELEYEIRKV
jgi:uncharacterized Fe-S center protein